MNFDIVAKLKAWAGGNKLRNGIVTGLLMMGAAVALMFGQPEKADVAYDAAKEFNQVSTTIPQ